jgi:hypothetical protein
MRGILLAAAILCGAVVADKSFDDGKLTDGALSMLTQIMRAFGY